MSQSLKHLSVYIDPELHRWVKLQAFSEGKSVKALVTELLEAEKAQQEGESE